MKDILFKLLKNCIIALFGAVILYLWLLAGVSTTVIGLDSISEHPVLRGDSILANVLVAIAFFAVIYLLSRHNAKVRSIAKAVNDDERRYRTFRSILLFFIAGVSIVFVVALRKTPSSDQMDIVRVSGELMQGDYSAFEKAGYLDICPHQTGIVIVLYLMRFIVGERVAIAFQLMNVLALTLTYKTFGDIVEFLGFGRLCSLMTVAMSGLFLPGILYSTFVYGVVPGVCLSVLATWSILKFYKESLYRYAAFAALLSFGAIVFKSNFMIFLMGNLICAAILMLRKDIANKRFWLIIPALLIVLIFSKNVVNGMSKAMFGYEPGRGISNFAYLAMGLQENDSLYDGWWNYYNERTYVEADYDTDEQEVVVFEYLRERFAEFKSDPKMAIEFFAGKNASQWNNPDFQSIWENRYMKSRNENSLLERFLFSMSGMTGMITSLNYLQFIILTGVIAFILLGRDRADGYLAFMLTFLGGFVFHTFWEAKAQYTFPYFILLIPISVVGLKRLCAIGEKICHRS